MAFSIQENSKASWITPEEQLRRLAYPLTEKVDKLAGLIPDLADIAAQYALDPDLILWYFSLKKIDKLPKKIPPLPSNIHSILNMACPERICSSKKPDGSFYTLGEKCTLTLIPEELGTIKIFENRVKAYGETLYPKEKNPLQFKNFWQDAYEELGNKPFATTHWSLQTDEIIEKSRNQSYQMQERLVGLLSQESHLPWQPPSLHDTIGTIFLKKLATGKTLYQEASVENGYIYNYTGVRETTDEWRLVAGNFSPQGLNVICRHTFASIHTGISATLRF